MNEQFVLGQEMRLEPSVLPFESFRHLSLLNDLLKELMEKTIYHVWMLRRDSKSECRVQKDEEEVGNVCEFDWRVEINPGAYVIRGCVMNKSIAIIIMQKNRWVWNSKKEREREQTLLQIEVHS